MPKKRKISELPICETFKGLWTIGVDALNRSVKVSLEYIEQTISAFKQSIEEVIGRADKAVSNAETAAKKAEDVASDARIATSEALESAKKADAAADKASTATDSANKATEGANTAISEINKVKGLAETATNLANKAASNAQETADHPTYIGDDYFVYRWDVDAKKYIPTNVYVKGETSVGVADPDTLRQIKTGIIFSPGDFGFPMQDGDDPNDVYLTYNATNEDVEPSRPYPYRRKIGILDAFPRAKEYVGDVNILVQEGVYFCDTATGATNLPDGVSTCAITVFPINGDNVVQCVHTGGYQYYRTIANTGGSTTWSVILPSSRTMKAYPWDSNRILNDKTSNELGLGDSGTYGYYVDPRAAIIAHYVGYNERAQIMFSYYPEPTYLSYRTSNKGIWSEWKKIADNTTAFCKHTEYNILDSETSKNVVEAGSYMYGNPEWTETLLNFIARGSTARIQFRAYTSYTSSIGNFSRLYYRCGINETNTGWTPWYTLATESSPHSNSLYSVELSKSNVLNRAAAYNDVSPIIDEEFSVDSSNSIHIEDKPTEQEIRARTLIEQRNQLLQATDKFAVVDYPFSSLEEKQSIFKWRQELRDFPQNPDFPNIELPEPPACLSVINNSNE